jgi:hypothetical protein
MPWRAVRAPRLPATGDADRRWRAHNGTSRTTLEVAMSLPIGERRKLRRIEKGIASTDPRLAALYTMFGRLSRLETMPRLERVRAGTIRRAARVKRKTALWTFN